MMGRWVMVCGLSLLGWGLLAGCSDSCAVDTDCPLLERCAGSSCTPIPAPSFTNDPMVEGVGAADASMIDDGGFDGGLADSGDVGAGDDAMKASDGGLAWCLPLTGIYQPSPGDSCGQQLELVTAVVSLPMRGVSCRATVSVPPFFTVDTVIEDTGALSAMLGVLQCTGRMDFENRALEATCGTCMMSVAWDRPVS